MLVIDYNRMQALGFTSDTLELDPLAQKFAAFNWASATIDGHSFPEIVDAYDRLPFSREKPSVIVADTVKGKGVSFMENKLQWHYCCPGEEDYVLACKELEL